METPGRNPSTFPMQDEYSWYIVQSSHHLMFPSPIRTHSPKTLTRLNLFGLVALLLLPFAIQADEASDAEKAVQALVRPLEKEGFVFRADAWVKELKPEIGKAVRVQLFKGNDYRFCVAVPPQSGVQITATVLDFEGKPGGDLRLLEDGWGLVLNYQPKKTGVYVIAVRQSEKGQSKPTVCAMVTGYQ